MNDSHTDVNVVLIHGWPGLPSDFDQVRAELPQTRVITPELRGFGTEFHGELVSDEATAEAHARRLLTELDDLGVTTSTVVAGYDIGSRVAQAALRLDPSRFTGAVLTPAYPGIGDRAGLPQFSSIFWYQHFHREPIASELIDGNPEAVRQYISYLWGKWSGPSSPTDHPQLDDVVQSYARPGAFAASIQWYAANRGYAGDQAALETPVTMLWPTEDPLFPLEWADRLGESFRDVTLQPVENCGHFLPLERPSAMADAIRSHLPTD